MNENEINMSSNGVITTKEEDDGGRCNYYCDFGKSVSGLKRK
jgi:hypothetical protein